MSACAGSDNGRPKAAVASDAGDPDADCAAAANLTLQRITDFEPAPGTPAGLEPVATCDPSIDAMKNDCMYFNYDTAADPHDCGSGTPSPATCVQSNGDPQPDNFCFDNTNFPSAGPRVPVTQIPGSRCGVSNYAFHLVGTNVAACYNQLTRKQGWGITLQITLNASSGNAGISDHVFDARSWTGISFWARQGTGASGSAILASIEDPYTANAGSTTGFVAPAMCPPGESVGADGGTCFIQCSSAATTSADAQKCDPFGLGVGLGSEWRFIKIPFADVKQKGFGVPSQQGTVDTSALVGLQFALNAGDWDVWIDDIAFYREPS